MAPERNPEGKSDTQDSPTLVEDRTVCFCHNVSLLTLKAAIAAGAHDIVAIQAETCASTGCGGCQFEVEEVLTEELARLKSEAS
jgi:nitrite reductase (NADH) large subunit